MMSMHCIIWLEDEEGGNEVEWSSGRKTGEHNTKNLLYKTVEQNRKIGTPKGSLEITLKTDILLSCY